MNEKTREARYGPHSTYYNAQINRQDPRGLSLSGYRLPWTATLPNGNRVAADTLRGIKQAIRNNL